MSVALVNIVWEQNRDLGGNDLLVMLALAWWADDDNMAWPSVKSISERAHVSERTAQYILRRLHEQGYITINEGRGRTHTSSYQVNPEHFECAEKVQQSLHLLNKEGGQEKVQSDAEKVQVATEKVQNSALKGAIAIAPERHNRQRTDKGKTLTREKKKPQTDCPPTFELTEERIQYAKEAGFRGDVKHLDFVTQTFLSHHGSKGSRFTDWGKAWQTWIRNSISYGQDLPKDNGGSRNGTNRPKTAREQAIKNGFEQAFGIPLEQAFGKRSAGEDEDYQAGSIRQLPRPGSQAG